MGLGVICDIIILVAAVLVAITNIYNFFKNSGKGIKKKAQQIQENRDQEFQEKVRDTVTPMMEQQATTLTASFGKLLDQHLPTRLTEHDLETRKKYLADRQKYLCDIKDEVVRAMQDRLTAVDTHEDRMMVFSEVLKELLRERIMAIYGRNRARRQLEEHEKVELDRAYALYKSLLGNSYIDDYYSRMMTWEVIPDDDHVN